jgi:hypothetical protein
MCRPNNVFTSTSGEVGTHAASVSINLTNTQRNVPSVSAFCVIVKPIVQRISGHEAPAVTRAPGRSRIFHGQFSLHIRYPK